MRTKAFLLGAMLVLSAGAFAETIEVKPVGEYANIKVEHDNSLVRKLLGNNPDDVKQAGEEALHNLDGFNPVVLYVLSNVYFGSDKDGAAMIFYVGQMRARIDANLCADDSARDAVSILNESYGPLINKYTLQSKDRAVGIVTKAIAYVRTHDVTYDRRWINLHGMNAMSLDGSVNPAPLSIPKDQWDATIKKTVDDYESGFLKAIETFDFSKVPQTE